MKKGYKRSCGIFGALVTALVAVILAVSLTGCFGAKAKTFEKEGMSITLTDDFFEKSVVSQTAYYESKDALVLAVKEEFAYLNGGNGRAWDVSQYTDLVLSINNMPELEKQTREGKAYMYFAYEKTVTGRDFYYLATTHKGEDAFWLIQFACLTSQKDSLTGKFFEWADSITFASTASTPTV